MISSEMYLKCIKKRVFFLMRADSYSAESRSVTESERSEEGWASGDPDVVFARQLRDPGVLSIRTVAAGDYMD